MAEQRPDIEKILARAEAATAGPWFWDVNRHSKAMHLYGKGWLFVIDFVRWGMQSAKARFQGSVCMVDADTLAAPVEGEKHHFHFRADIDHPDAQFITASRTDVPALARYAQWLEAELDNRTNGRWSADQVELVRLRGKEMFNNILQAETEQLQKRMKELGAELDRVAPFLALHGVEGYTIKETDSGQPQ